MVPVFLLYLDHSFRIFGEGGGYVCHNIDSRSTLATYAWRAPLQPASSRQNECPMWYNRQPVKLEKPTHAQSQPVLASGALVSLVGLVPILCDFLGSCHSKGKLHMCEFHENVLNFHLTRNVAILSHLSGHVGRVRRLEHTNTTHFAGGLHLSQWLEWMWCFQAKTRKSICMSWRLMFAMHHNQLLSIADCINLVQLPHVLHSKTTFICVAALLTACKPIQASLGAHAGVSST